MSASQDDCLTVMNYNTYLLEVTIGIQIASKPNLDQRADGIAEWFATLSPGELPDVLVFNEIYAYAAERMLQRLACTCWSKNRPFGVDTSPFLECDPRSQFSAVTRVVNATWFLNPVKEGGVVILARRGLVMRSAHERAFTTVAGSDALSLKGFWAVEVLKGLQPYWILGTHAQAHPSADKAAVRYAQFCQMREFVDEMVPDGARVCFAGDLNTSMPDEDKQMLQAFGSPGAPATVGCLVPRGFWVGMDEDLVFSLDWDRNHYVAANPHDFNQNLDWIVAPGPNDRLATPTAMRYQYVPVKADKYMISDAIKGTPTDDLSDHYGVFAQMWYGTGPCPEIAPVKGHRGVEGRLPCNLPDKVLAAIGRLDSSSDSSSSSGSSRVGRRGDPSVC